MPVTPREDRVEKAQQLVKEGRVHPQGCSELVCEVLGIAWQDANSLLGDDPTDAGTNNHYPTLTPGDIVGWKAAAHGHVAVYIGDAGDHAGFIDVRGEGEAPRHLTGYGATALKKSSIY